MCLKVREAVGRLRAALADRLSERFDRRGGAAVRRRQLAPARGRTLEVGAGTGRSLEHVPPAVTELVLTEPDRALLRRAERRLAHWGRAARLLAAPAERLPFPDDAFDTVTCTAVLCTVSDQAAALAEIRRVLAPGGQLLFAEHVRAEDPALARRQDRLERPWRLIAGGCHPNRDTVAALARAGFDVRVEERGELPGVPRLVRPYVLGRALVAERAAAGG